MIDAILNSLPIAFGIVIATLPGLAIPLILLTRRELGVLYAFMAGYAAGFILLGGLIILLADLFTPNPNGPAEWIFWLRILLGLTLLALAFRKWQGRTLPGEDAELPSWMQKMDTIKASRAALVGFVLIVLNPKNAVLVAAGVLAIVAATPSPLAQGAALLVFTAVAGSGLASPLVVWLLLGERAMGPVDQLKLFLARNNSLIMTAVLATLGFIVLANALS